MIEVIPAVIPQNLNIVREKLSRVLGLVKKVQIDIVDGEYAPSKTWPFAIEQGDELLKMVRGEEKFPYIDDFVVEIDILAHHPIEYISDFLSIGMKSFVIHIDSTDHVKECIETIKSAKCDVGLGIKPSVDSMDLEPYLLDIDFVQFMGNDRVGYNGVELDMKVLDKIKDFHQKYSLVPLQIDIGVNTETATSLKKAGITRLISGSAIFDATDIKKAIITLQTL